MDSRSITTTTDHETIRSWAEARGGRPARVVGHMSHGDVGELRIEFPRHRGREPLELLTWAEFFDAFEAEQLAIVLQFSTASGDPSRFNRVVLRTSARPGSERASCS